MPHLTLVKVSMVSNLQKIREANIDQQQCMHYNHQSLADGLQLWPLILGSDQSNEYSLEYPLWAQPNTNGIGRPQEQHQCCPMSNHQPSRVWAANITTTISSILTIFGAIKSWEIGAFILAICDLSNPTNSPAKTKICTEANRNYNHYKRFTASKLSREHKMPELKFAAYCSCSYIHA